MQAGTLDKNILIYGPVIVRDEFGSQHTEYVQKYNTRAHIESKTGNKSNENGDILTLYQITFIVRHYIDIDEYCQIHYKGKKYHILSVDDNYNDQRILHCELINE